MRVCNICNVEKPVTDYYEHRGSNTAPGYRIPTCKKCHAKKSMKWAKDHPKEVAKGRRKHLIKQKYGLSLEEYTNMFNSQGGLCKLCNKEHKRRPLNVDHCHKTGEIRGLLCDKCNLALGLLGDDLLLIDKIKEYLS